MKRLIILIFFVILSYNMYGQQFTQGVFANITLITHHKYGTSNLCYDEEISYPFPGDVPTGINLYIRIDSIAGPCDSVQVYRFPDYMYIFIPVHDTINLSVNQSHDIYLYYACNATVYISLVAIGTPQILHESYDCNYSDNDQPIYDDNCIYLITMFGASDTCSVSNSTNVKETVCSNHADVYPNPAKNSLTITATGLTGKTIATVYDLRGQQILQHNMHQAKEEINIGSLAPGVYIIKVCSGDGVAVRKFVKE